MPLNKVSLLLLRLCETPRCPVARYADLLCKISPESATKYVKRV